MSTQVYFVVPDSIDEPARVSGGNVYDQRVRSGLRDAGWDVRMLLIPSSAPHQDAASPVEHALAQVPDDAVVVIDGLIAVRESAALTAHSRRLRIVVLAHMVASAATPAAALPERESAALHAARRIIATSEWTRSELTTRDLAEPGTIAVAPPGTNRAAQTVTSDGGGRLLCVGAVAPHKGQDLLVNALAQLRDIDDWTCTIVGSHDVAPRFAAELAQTVQRAGLDNRVTFTGALTGSALDAAYGAADLLVVPSRSESFGMVITEALARGIPVVATRVGGIPEALVSAAAGMLVDADRPQALESALREWLTGADARRRLTAAAVRARESIRPWSETTAIIAATLSAVAQKQGAPNEGASRTSTLTPTAAPA